MQSDLLAELDAWSRLTWAFSFLVVVVPVLLVLLYLRIRRAEKREIETLVISEEAIAVQEAERLRIYMELHDDILPSLTDRAVAARLREICAGLMPPDFSRLPLSDLLISLCTGFARKTGIACDYDVRTDIDASLLDAGCRLHVYRIAQEAFNNITKHSGASRATFTADCRNGEDGPSVLLYISDEGVGLTPESAGSRGMGMSAMRQRAAIIGARLDFIDQKGGGSVVRLEIPEKKLRGGGGGCRIVPSLLSKMSR
jgi:two-component system NarL family sensor kinase